MKDPEKYGGVMWKDDPIEKSRRVWEWWKANHSAPSIHYFAITARLVALSNRNRISFIYDFKILTIGIDKGYLVLAVYSIGINTNSSVLIIIGIM